MTMKLNSIELTSVIDVKIEIEFDAGLFWATAFDPSSFGYIAANGDSEEKARANLAKAAIEQALASVEVFDRTLSK